MEDCEVERLDTELALLDNLEILIIFDHSNHLRRRIAEKILASASVKSRFNHACEFPDLGRVILYDCDGGFGMMISCSG